MNHKIKEYLDDQWNIIFRPTLRRIKKKNIQLIKALEDNAKDIQTEIDNEGNSVWSSVSEWFVRKQSQNDDVPCSHVRHGRGDRPGARPGACARGCAGATKSTRNLDLVDKGVDFDSPTLARGIDSSRGFQPVEVHPNHLVSIPHAVQAAGTVGGTPPLAQLSSCPSLAAARCLSVPVARRRPSSLGGWR